MEMRRVGIIYIMYDGQGCSFPLTSWRSASPVLLPVYTHQSGGGGCVRRHSCVCECECVYRYKERARADLA